MEALLGQFISQVHWSTQLAAYAAYTVAANCFLPEGVPVH